MSPATSSRCREIKSVVDRVYAPLRAEAELRLSKLTILGVAHRFVITRMGSTGSSWLAKLLDSHPEVLCTHEGFLALAYPSEQFNHQDVLRFLEYFAWDTKHDAYDVLGDVGSVLTYHLSSLYAFSKAILVRHPARMLNTRLTVYPAYKGFANIPAESQTAIREIWGIDLNEYEPIDQVFLHDTFTFASQVAALDDVDLVIRIEDMSDVGKCQKALKSLTGFEYSDALVEHAVQNRVNRRTRGRQSVSEIVGGFTARQRDWYNSMLADVVPCFGYELGNG
jgi:hypothetical protein